MQQGISGPAGISFPPTLNGKIYLSVYYHRGAGSRAHKNVWASHITPPMEYEIFYAADAGDWFTTDGHYWGVKDKGETELGTRGQRLCKFPSPSNPADTWHGYPVSPMEDAHDAPPDDFVENWIIDQVVTKTI